MGREALIHGPGQRLPALALLMRKRGWCPLVHWHRFTAGKSFCAQRGHSPPLLGSVLTTCLCVPPPSQTTLLNDRKPHRLHPSKTEGGVH